MFSANSQTRAHCFPEDIRLKKQYHEHLTELIGSIDWKLAFTIQLNWLKPLTDADFQRALRFARDCRLRVTNDWCSTASYFMRPVYWGQLHFHMLLKPNGPLKKMSPIGMKYRVSNLVYEHARGVWAPERGKLNGRFWKQKRNHGFKGATFDLQPYDPERGFAHYILNNRHDPTALEHIDTSCLIDIYKYVYDFWDNRKYSV